MKPSFSVDQGKIIVKGTQAVDADKDGKSSAKITVEVELDAAEVVSEVLKKDIPLLETILKQVKG